jgi:hypothetical protein
MAVTRAGMALTVVAALITGAALVTVAAIAARSASRRVEVNERAQRIQGREWCLGAASLASGTRLVVGAWEITRGADGSRVARGPRGTYSIAPDGRETWRRR